MRDDFSIIYEETYEQIYPEEAAHELLGADVFNGQLPTELEDFREYGEFSTYQRWWSRVRGGENPERPHWDTNQRALYFGTRMYKKLAPQAKLQCAVLNALEGTKWPLHEVAVMLRVDPSKERPLRGQQLIDTLKAMRKWLVDTPIQLYRVEDKVGWTRRRKSA